MRPLRLLALASAARALQFSPAKPLRRRALQRRIRREADWIANPSRGMDPEVLQQDDALDDLVHGDQDRPLHRGRGVFTVGSYIDEVRRRVALQPRRRLPRWAPPAC